MKINDYLLWLGVGMLGCYVLYMVFKFSLLSGVFFLPLLFVGKSIFKKKDQDKPK